MMTEFDMLHAAIRKRMNEIADVVSTGGAADYADYRKMCGMIEGLALAERDLIDLIEKLKRD